MNIHVTKREHEVLYWLNKGKTNEQMAKLFGVSVRTVENHMSNLREKFMVEDRLNLLLEAWRLAII